MRQAQPVAPHPAGTLPAAVAHQHSTPDGLVEQTVPAPGSDAIDNGPQVNDPAAGTITTVAGGSADGSTALQSTFYQPDDAAVGPDGTVYVADTYDNRIRAIDPATDDVRTIAGTGDAGFSGDGGPATEASLNFPTSVTLDGNGLLVTDSWNDRIRRVDLSTGSIATVAGIGPNDAIGNPPCGQGVPGPATSAVLNEPEGVAVDKAGNIYIADTGCDTVERVDAGSGAITDVAGVEGIAGAPANGPTSTALDLPLAIAVDPLGNPVFADDANRIAYVNLLTHPVVVYPSSASPVTVNAGFVQTIAGDGNVPVPSAADGDGGEATAAELASPHHLFAAPDGSLLFTEDISYTTGGSSYFHTMRVRRIDWSSGIVTKLAGDEQIGIGDENVAPAQTPLSYPQAAFVTADGGVDVLDTGNDRLRRIDPATALVATLAGRPNNGSPVLGDGLPAPDATLNWPRSVAVNPANGSLYVADSLNLRIRRVDPGTGMMSTIIGTGEPCVRAGVGWQSDCENDAVPPDSQPGTDMRLFYNDGTGMSALPSGLLAFDDEIDQAVWVYNDSSVPVTLFQQSSQPLTVAPGYVQRLAGGGGTAVPPTGSEPALSAALEWPSGLAFASSHELVVSEQLANRVDLINLDTGQVSILAGAPYTIPECTGPLPLVGCVPSPERDTYLDGPAALAHFFQPIGLSVAPDGSVYVADTGNNRIRRIDRTQGLVTTVAGNGNGGFQGDGLAATLAEIVEPTDVAVAPDGSFLITDWGNERIRRVDTTGIMRTFAGSGLSRVNNACGSTVPCGHYSGDGGVGPAATLDFPFGGANFSALGPDGRLYVADTLNNRIRAVQLLPTPTAQTPEAPVVAFFPLAALAVIGVTARRRRAAGRRAAPTA